MNTGFANGFLLAAGTPGGTPLQGVWHLQNEPLRSIFWSLVLRRVTLIFLQTAPGRVTLVTAICFCFFGEKEVEEPSR
jgi:hypothetical protein